MGLVMMEVGIDEGFEVGLGYVGDCAGRGRDGCWCVVGVLGCFCCGGDVYWCHVLGVG